MYVNKYGSYVKKWEPCSQYPEKRTQNFNKDRYEVIIESKKQEELRAEFLTESCLTESIIALPFLSFIDIKFSLGNYCRGWANHMELKHKDY